MNKIYFNEMILICQMPVIALVDTKNVGFLMHKN